jgi:hypothetical protein
MKTDYLILLLSTDWFFPFWSEIGMVLNDATKRSIQAGCRAIVQKLMANAKEYYQIDFSEKRHHETYSMLVELIEGYAGQSDSLIAANVWLTGPEDDLKSSIMLRMLTHDLLLGDSEAASPASDPSARMAVMVATKTYDADPDQFWIISTQSQSAWDHYIQDLLAETPSALSDIASFTVQERRLKELWNRICQSLTQSQVEDLISWYRAMAKRRGIPIDPVPRYML